MKLKDLPLSERPRERLERVGIENISNEELLSIIIKTVTKNNSVKDLACQVLNRIKELHNLESINLNTFKDIKGLGRVKTIEIMSAIELGRRIFLGNNSTSKLKYNSPDIIYKDNLYLFRGKKQECFYCLYLDNKNSLIERKMLFMGTINRSVVHPREVFKEAYLTSASNIICMHNHPSGDINPSSEDIRLTKALIDIGKIQGIRVLDHMIVADNSYYSFYEEKKDLFL